MLRRFTSNIIFIVFLQAFAYNASAHVYIDYPYGGETFYWGSTVTIQWHVHIPHNTLNWDLFFSGDGGETWNPLILDLPYEQLEYAWTVPDSLTSLARIRVVQDNDIQDYWDNCGNFTMEAYTAPPLLDAPASDTIIECGPNQIASIQTWLNNHGGAAVTNYCGELVWTNDFNALENECGGSGIAVVNFTATDECGSVETNATLTIIDSSPPSMTTPASNMTVVCNGSGNTSQLNNWLNTRGGAQVFDICSNVTWTNNFTNLSNECGTSGSASVIFTATDECGNSTTTQATFTIEDHIAPAITSSAQNVTIECGTPGQENQLQTWLDNHGSASANDLCGNVSWTNNFSSLSDGCATTGSASVIFTATDDCGNSASTVATFAYSDNMPPVIHVQARDTTLDCSSPDVFISIQQWIDDHAGARANDLCGNVSWVNDFQGLTDSCHSSSGQVIKFICFDECGHSDTTSATLNLTVTTTSANQQIAALNFKVYPNPASDILQIAFGKSEFPSVELILFDVFGNALLHKQEDPNKIRINVSTYPPGIYFIRVKTLQGSTTRKVVIE